MQLAQAIVCLLCLANVHDVCKMFMSSENMKMTGNMNEIWKIYDRFVKWRLANVPQL